jgi:hypothetical protein
MMNACQSEAIEVEILSKTSNIELKPLSSSLRDKFLDPNETYPVCVNINLNLAQTESTLVFFLKITHSINVNLLKTF